MPDTPSLSIGPVSERDITLLLLEEFYTSECFSQWVVEKLFDSCPASTAPVQTSCSVMEENGESDLEVGFASAQGKIWLLIENKLDAPFQPHQAERYHERGRLYVARGQCAQFYTVLIAPERYFGDPQALKGFNKKLTYEALRTWFLEQSTRESRQAFKVALLDAAINKTRATYQLTPDQAVSMFWQGYRDMVQRYAPELQIGDRPERGSASGFINFRTEGLPKNVHLIHKILKNATQGHVDLEFRGMGARFREFEQTFSGHLAPGMRPTRAGASGVIRLVVPRLDLTGNFASQAAGALAGLNAAKRLAEWLRNHQSLIEEQVTTWGLAGKR
jgi:hypothetical protein